MQRLKCVTCIFQLLLSQENCPIDPVDEDKLTPLHEAIQLKQVHVAKYLVIFSTTN